MPSTKGSKSAPKPASSADLQALVKRVQGSSLSSDDKAMLSEIMTQTIKLKKLVEKSKTPAGNKVVIASLPYGFDIVK